MKNLNLVAQSTNYIDDFDIDDLIKDDPDTYIDANDPELRCSKFLYAIRKIESDIEKCKQSAESIIAEVNLWLDTKLQQKESQVEFMCNYMQNYLTQKQLKSLQLPAGNIGFRKQPERLEVIDEDKFMESATFDIIKVEPEKFKPDLSAIKAKLKETGELPAGVDLVTPPPKFYYKLNGKV